MAIVAQDSSRLVDAFLELHVLSPEVNRELIQSAFERLFIDIWGKSAKDMTEMSLDEMRFFAERLGHLLTDLPFRLPEDLVLLGRCLNILSGIACSLSPDFNPWERLVPYARRLIGTSAIGRGFRLALQELSQSLRTLVGLPKRPDSHLSRAERLHVDRKIQALSARVEHLNHKVTMLTGLVLLCSLLLAMILIRLLGT